MVLELKPEYTIQFKENQYHNLIIKSSRNSNSEVMKELIYTVNFKQQETTNFRQTIDEEFSLAYIG